ncbi:hypothetical protein J2X69_003642 [Algoriphagus sp. 4150]|uniref:hypothetical protein n=1 Tax=Algoriphagus sp. 4150 TaxID=2817756 RepID=UPI0028556F1E|nr:hypothetical protein [Algoriphagus sp. 4150]MDR7131281.1 hypothetical protein [Algoriphagus sp. 4150]
MLNNFFRINLPYGIIRNDKGEWMAFNREYMPLGYNDTEFKGRLPIAFEDKPIWTKYKALNEKTLLAISWDDEEGVRRDSAGKIEWVFFYNDKSNPSASKLKSDWDAYFEKIKCLSNFKKA